MRDFVNPLSNTPLEKVEETDKDQSIELIDGDTVSYGKNGVGLKRSLSLNVYKYDTYLGTKESERYSAENVETLSSIKKVVDGVEAPKQTSILRSLQLVGTACCSLMLVVVMIKVFENGTRGKI